MRYRYLLRTEEKVIRIIILLTVTPDDFCSWLYMVVNVPMLEQDE